MGFHPRVRMLNFQRQSPAPIWCTGCLGIPRSAHRNGQVCRPPAPAVEASPSPRVDVTLNGRARAAKLTRYAPAAPGQLQHCRYLVGLEHRLSPRNKRGDLRTNSVLHQSLLTQEGAQFYLSLPAQLCMSPDSRVHLTLNKYPVPTYIRAARARPSHRGASGLSFGLQDHGIPFRVRLRHLALMSCTFAVIVM
jgi:hypothetical protein